MNYQMEFDPDTGEWLNEDEWESIKMDKTEKIKNTIKVIENKTALREAIKAKEKGMNERVKTLDREIEHLKYRVGASLNYEKFETEDVRVTFRKSESVEILNPEAVPERFLKNEVVKTPQKPEIKKYLKEKEAEGEEVPWAKLNRKNNMVLK